MHFQEDHESSPCMFLSQLSYPLSLDFESSESIWQNGRGTFSLSLLVFIIKFIYRINTFLVILLKCMRSCLFTVRNPFAPSHQNNKILTMAYNPLHDLTLFLSDPIVWSLVQLLSSLTLKDTYMFLSQRICSRRW